MAQKDKIKELVGGGLNAYHTKSLQQMDRIEKKNKQQNHKISILSNELDNDYLTKTEEGSVISLEHSKEGMVYLDELQGNTLINYCTDGSKEMTLNGDIDLEGTFVTTTEGVDNGLVDVMCEGNTLVNIANNETVKGTRRNGNIIITPTKQYSQFSVTHSELMSKLNTTYTIRIEVLSNTSTVPLVANKYNGTFNGWNGIEAGFTGEKIFTYTTGSEYQFTRWFWVENNVVGEGEIEIRLTILEGDWTNKEIPPYFEGMKSVGQDDENSHKIEILSRNDKLIINKDKLLNEGIFYGTKGWSAIRLVTKAKRIKIVVTNKDGLARQTKLSVKNDIESEVRARQLFGMNESFNKVEIDYELLDTNILSFCVYGENDFNGDFFDYYDIEVFSYDNIEDVTPTTRYNKKEILLNEPLRGLPNGVCDKFVKQSGKWYVERNCGFSLIDGNYNWYGSARVQGSAWAMQTREEIPNLKQDGTAICDKYSVVKRYIDNAIDSVEISSVKNKVILTLRDTTSGLVESSTEAQIQEKMKEITSNNPFKIVYQLEIPTYEEIIDPTLITYLDTTHISNNSIIPCNMKVKNSGYNAIIKPSTLYTVALDTNKSGTIGMNLGGAKGTTTNNVLTLTTPVTLTDDSLRIYGKGIKGSKVRLLEGDKTNWIPSFFEGMKSCFEDRVQEDGTYKMEILSNNKNLFNGTWVYDERNNKINSSDLIKVKPNTTYTISDNLNYRYQIYEYSDKSTHFNAMYPYAGSYTFTTNKRTHYLRFSTYAPSTDVDVKFILEEGRNITLYEPNKSNKIQFSSIEPLRGVGNVKDKFVFKDGKLMIERNCGEVTLNGSEDEHWIYHSLEPSNKYSYRTNCFSSKSKPQTSVKCNNFVSGNPSSAWTHRYNNIAILNTNNCHIYCDIKTLDGFKQWIQQNPTNVVYQLAEPYYEEIPFELQKIILEGYENGTLFIDTNIPPTVTTTYAGETPIVKSVRLNKTEVLNNTNDINDNIVPYLMDMDYRVVCLELATETQGISMARLFGGVYEMLKRDILSGRLSKEEYGYRLADYFNAGKLTEQQVKELEDLR